jgi:hypothetical protein
VGAINILKANGVATVVAFGNGGQDGRMTSPACISSAVSVAAVWDSNVGSQNVLGCTDSSTAADKVTCFSNTSSVTDLIAAGVPTRSTGIGGTTSTFLGTSQATPLVAACFATLMEAYPDASIDQMELAMESTGVTVTDTSSGLQLPRLDCMAAHVALALMLRGAVPVAGAWSIGAIVLALGSCGAIAIGRRADGQRPSI